MSAPAPAATERAVWMGRAPGRLDLMGGNVDYTGGLVFQATIREATWAVVERREDDRILLHNPQVSERGWRDRAEFSLASLTTPEAVRAQVNRIPELRWTAYVLGNFLLLKLRHPGQVTTGANVFIRSDVPLNKGVSSSAALEVAVMKTAARAYGIDLAGADLAGACQWVENVIAESACGIMDQMAVALGDEGSILPLLCQPCQPRPLVRLPEDLRCWGVDSGVSHAVTGVEYEAARAAAFMGYKLVCEWEGLAVEEDHSGAVPRFRDPVWNGYLANIPPSVFRSRYERMLPETLSGRQFLEEAPPHVDPFTRVREEMEYRIRANTRYAVEENARVRLFAELARGGQGFEEMGELMFQSHWAYTECGLGNEATDLVVELVRNAGAANGLYGAKVTGGGAGGTVAVLGHKDAADLFHRVVARYGEMRGFAPYVFEGSSPGADRFGVERVQPPAGE